MIRNSKCSCYVTEGIDLAGMWKGCWFSSPLAPAFPLRHWMKEKTRRMTSEVMPIPLNVSAAPRNRRMSLRETREKCPLSFLAAKATERALETYQSS